MVKAILSRVSMLGVMPGIAGISQAVAGQLVSRCADPTLTEAEFGKLVEDAAHEGYELTTIR
jgi:hypothetical protein